MGILDHLICLLRNQYADQEATVRTRHGTTYGFKIGKGVQQGCILSPCLFNYLQSTSYAFSKMLHLQEDSKKGLIQVLDNFQITPLNRRRNFKILMETLMVS